MEDQLKEIETKQKALDSFIDILAGAGDLRMKLMKEDKKVGNFRMKLFTKIIENDDAEQIKRTMNFYADMYKLYEEFAKQENL